MTEFFWPLITKIAIISLGIFYVAFSFLLKQKENRMREHLVSDAGNLLHRLCTINLFIAIILTILAIIIPA